MPRETARIGTEIACLYSIERQACRALAFVKDDTSAWAVGGVNAGCCPGARHRGSTEKENSLCQNTQKLSLGRRRRGQPSTTCPRTIMSTLGTSNVGSPSSLVEPWYSMACV